MVRLIAIASALSLAMAGISIAVVFTPTPTLAQNFNEPGEDAVEEEEEEEEEVEEAPADDAPAGVRTPPVGAPNADPDAPPAGFAVRQRGFTQVAPAAPTAVVIPITFQGATGTLTFTLPVTKAGIKAGLTALWLAAGGTPAMLNSPGGVEALNKVSDMLYNVCTLGGTGPKPPAPAPGPVWRAETRPPFQHLLRRRVQRSFQRSFRHPFRPLSPW